MSYEFDENPYRAPSPSSFGDGDPRSPRQRGQDSSNLDPIDWILCIFCGTIGCIIGIVRLVQGKPSGGKMIAFSILFGVIWAVVRIGILALMGEVPN